MKVLPIQGSNENFTELDPFVKMTERGRCFHIRVVSFGGVFIQSEVSNKCLFFKSIYRVDNVRHDHAIMSISIYHTMIDMQALYIYVS